MERDFCISRIRELVKPGDTIGTLTQHVARGEGSTRWVRLIISRGLHEGEAGPSDISVFAAGAIGVKYGRGGHAGVPFSETGTEQEAGVVLQLGRAVFRDGWECTGNDCPSGEHYDGGGAAPRTPGLVHHDVKAWHHKRL